MPLLSHIERLGSLAVTLAGVSVTSTGAVLVSAASSTTLGGISPSATGTILVAGSSSPVLAGVSVSLTGTVPVSGSSSATLDSISQSAAGTVLVTGALSATLAEVLVSNGPVGQLASTLDLATLSSAGVVAVSGSVYVTMAGVSLSAVATDTVEASLIIFEFTVPALVAIAKIYVNDCGTAFRCPVTGEQEETMDVSAATSLLMWFQRPDGTSFERDAELVTDGTDGVIQYVTEQGDLDQSGRWRVQPVVGLNGGVNHGNVVKFKVNANLRGD